MAPFEVHHRADRTGGNPHATLQAVPRSGFGYRGCGPFFFDQSGGTVSCPLLAWHGFVASAVPSSFHVVWSTVATPVVDPCTPAPLERGFWGTLLCLCAEESRVTSRRLRGAVRGKRGYCKELTESGSPQNLICKRTNRCPSGAHVPTGLEARGLLGGGTTWDGIAWSLFNSSAAFLRCDENHSQCLSPETRSFSDSALLPHLIPK